MRIKLYPPQAICELGKRSNQEDCIFPLLGKASVDDRLFILCDGMGGHERGEVASGAICNGLAEYFQKNIKRAEPFTDDLLKAALEYAYQQLDAKDNGAFRKAGTTLTLAYFHKGGCTAAHIGDSRIYHVRPDSRTILYKSRDHSLVFELYQMGEISYDEMKTHPRKNQISRAMIPGLDNRQEADIVHIPDIKPNDYFFICSDGILESIDDEDILNLLTLNNGDEAKRNMLVDMTNENDDNHSAYLIHVSDVETEASDKDLLNDEQTVCFNAINIHPALQKESDNDVTVISKTTPANFSAKKDNNQRNSPVTRSSRNYWLPIVALLLFFAIVILGYFVFNK